MDITPHSASPPIDGSAEPDESLRLQSAHSYESGRFYLPPRQREALVNAARGLTEREIAQAMGISVATVRMSLARVRETLDASNTAHAVALAFIHGVLCAGDIQSERRPQ